MCVSVSVYVRLDVCLCVCVCVRGGITGTSTRAELCLFWAIFTKQQTTQVKGSANIMVAVVATQELKAEDVLLRFKAEASRDKIHGMNSRYISARSVFANCYYTWHSSYFCVVLFFLFLVVIARVCMYACICVCVCDNLCCFPSDVCYFVQGNNACLRVAGSPRW